MYQELSFSWYITCFLRVYTQYSGGDAPQIIRNMVHHFSLQKGIPPVRDYAGIRFFLKVFETGISVLSLRMTCSEPAVMILSRRTR